jgi:hypothetical protein
MGGNAQRRTTILRAARMGGEAGFGVSARPQGSRARECRRALRRFTPL